MKTTQEHLERAYSFSRLLKKNIIREEIEQITNGYSIKNIEFKSKKRICMFKNEKGDCILLVILPNNISILKTTNDIIERITIDEDLLLSHRKVEKRKKGLIYSIIQKKFAKSKRFGNKIILVDLIEKRYTFTKGTIIKLIDNMFFNNDSLISFLIELRILENKVNLQKKCDYYSQFSTHTNYYYQNDTRVFKDNIYPTRTYINGEEISSIYDIDGPDKLYRIFDLYSGIINARNEKDINSIHLGLLSQDMFDLKGLKGITEQEDSLVGKSKKTFSQEYISYMKHILSNIQYKIPIQNPSTMQENTNSGEDKNKRSRCKGLLKKILRRNQKL